MKKAECKRCIWYDLCAEDGVCDSYEPASFEEQETVEVMAYEEDLHARHELYISQVSEQNE